jgi:hypothetical protein
VNKEDREILRRISDLNQSIGQLTVALLDHMEDGQLPPEGLCLVASEFDVIAELLRVRAAQITTTIESEGITMDGEVCWKSSPNGRH